MQVLILGSAAGGGLPQWNCGCSNCNKARLGKLQPQTQSSVAVSSDGNRWVLLNVSPDIRTQCLQRKQLHPRNIRSSPISSVILTNGDIDHVAGLLILREKTAFEIHATGEILSILKNNELFKALDPKLVAQKIISPMETFSPVSGIFVTAYYVPGKVPLFRESGKIKTDLESENTIGLEISNGSKTLQYVPGCARITPEILLRFKHSDHILFDGTVWQNDELRILKTGTKTGTRMGHVPISGPNGSLAELADIKKPSKTYIHINNTNPILDDKSKERLYVQEAGWEIAFDGMVIII